ncbi:STE/STE11 protein kinase [Thecamonas trahens ATCC 50062]|uniref:STE/STE11 protein kinase n=1 Tax=Thecamonas trahens ATCC 50062 TaxID=461836 RepID=A0A0L0DK53_THETB|nr:STE/STE11 protein kinase [Thecamonas trahens ATCC 50062]KNC52794.1 STE/STE11 protein kinase [Thecamonas trahens ATCC 50062]|eukprot:XP_013755104.1 STE/STE11 protein kinase [Thecamonas trahens ATCC 50062]
MGCGSSRTSQTTATTSRALIKHRFDSGRPSYFEVLGAAARAIYAESGARDLSVDELNNLEIDLVFFDQDGDPILIFDEASWLLALDDAKAMASRAATSRDLARKAPASPQRSRPPTLVLEVRFSSKRRRSKRLTRLGSGRSRAGRSSPAPALSPVLEAKSNTHATSKSGEDSSPSSGFLPSAALPPRPPGRAHGLGSSSSSVGIILPVPSSNGPVVPVEMTSTYSMASGESRAVEIDEPSTPSQTSPPTAAVAPRPTTFGDRTGVEGGDLSFVHITKHISSPEVSSACDEVVLASASECRTPTTPLPERSPRMRPSPRTLVRGTRASPRMTAATGVMGSRPLDLGEKSAELSQSLAARTVAAAGGLTEPQLVFDDDEKDLFDSFDSSSSSSRNSSSSSSHGSGRNSPVVAGTSELEVIFDDDENALFASINSDSTSSSGSGSGSGSRSGSEAGEPLSDERPEPQTSPVPEPDLVFDGEVAEAEAVAAKDGAIRWKRGRLLGMGAFGKVYIGIDLDRHQPMAVKVVEFVPPPHPRGEKADGELPATMLREMTEAEREIELLKSLRHDNIVRYIGASKVVDSAGTHALHIFLEFVGCGSLATLLAHHRNADGSAGLDEATSRAYMYQILEGLLHLHDHKVIHRDIKAGNVLISKQPSFPALHTMKIADFGASTTFSTVAPVHGHTLAGTPNFMAPEVIRQEGHSLKADIWSVGCLVIEMLTGLPPWPKSEPMAVLFSVAQHKRTPPLPNGISAALGDFLARCFAHNPAQRPSAAALLRHAWFDGIAQLPADSLDATVVAAIDIDDIAAEIDELMAASHAARPNAKVSFSFASHAKASTRINAHDEKPLSATKSLAERYAELLASGDDDALAEFEAEMEASAAPTRTASGRLRRD